MKNQSVLKQVGLLFLLPVVVLAATMPIQAREAEPDLQSSNFVTAFGEIAPQGFGDRHNSKAWSMIWWKDHLYVGTARAHMCVEFWALADAIGPPFYYPPKDPDYECTEDNRDLPLQAEIWRYSPATRVWERVFQSPQVPIPDDPDGKLTGRDAGFRGIAAFTDPDGTDALYIGGVTTEVMFPGLIPPRILRSEDGETWEPVPHDPGTVLGDLARRQANFRGMEVFNDRLYVVNGDMRGGGAVLEAENPAGGNDYFRWVTPEDLNVYEVAAFDDHLYVGTEAAPDSLERGYRVLKTTATGEPPYEFELIVDEGAYFDFFPSNAVVAMYVYDGRLYVGTDKPAEMIRINPEPEIPPENPWDLWDLVVGWPRVMPDGITVKTPISGFGFGFDWIWNEHIWRMQEHQGNLYVGTNDATGFLKTYEFAKDLLPLMGYDLYVSPDGVEYTMLTQTGFADEGYGDQLGIGIRVFASTPHGLFFGTSNPFYGLRMYGSLEHRVFLPLVLSSQPAQGDLTSGFGTAMEVGRSLSYFGAPKHAWLENHDGAAVLSWEPVSGAARYRIYRSDFSPAQELGIDLPEQDAWIPKPYNEIGIADSTFYLDRTALPDRLYHYYVRAEGSNGVLSQPSNLARSPSLNTPVTLSGLRMAAAKWMAESHAQAVGETEDVPVLLSVVDEQMAAGDQQAALESLEALRVQASSDRLPQLSWWRAEDLSRLLGKLMRRIQLAQAGVLSPLDLR